MVQVSLIMTVYNRSAYMGASIESVLGQSYRDFELIVWDDGSTDDSLRLARGYAERDGRIRVFHGVHAGRSHALISAHAQAVGPYVGWIDSDDLLAPTALEETVAVLDAHPTTGMVYSDYWDVNEQKRSQQLGRRCQIEYSPERLLLDFMTFHFRLMRRSCYEAVGGVDTRFMCAMDYDLCLKLSEITTIYHLQKPLYYYRIHGQSISQSRYAEQLAYSKQAVSEALERRGLNYRYQIEVSHKGQFKLQRREPDCPLVSIIIYCHNAEGSLVDCLKSCFSQTYPNIEIIVIDDHSTDGSVELIRQGNELSPHPMQYYSCCGSGVSHGRCEGFSLAQGAYIQWLDAEDRLEPEKIALQVGTLERSPDADIAYGDWTWNFYAGEELKLQYVFVGQSYEDYLLQLLINQWQPCHSYLLRRSAAERLDQIGAWNPDRETYVEREYFTLAGIIGLKFCYVKHSRVHYKQGVTPRRLTPSPAATQRQELQGMFERFQKYAQRQLDGRISEEHRRLLKQDGRLWRPAFRLKQEDGYGYVLQHVQRGTEIALQRNEAIIIRTLLCSEGVYTLEDQVRWVVHRLVQGVVLYMANVQGIQCALNDRAVWRQLSVLVGFAEVSVPDDDALFSYVLNLEVDGLRGNSIESQWVELIPLGAPLFSEHRLIVHCLLVQLQRGGWYEAVVGLEEKVV